MPWSRAALYMLTSLLLSLTQGLGMNLAAANLPQLQGPLGATTNEVTWLIAAYMAPNVSLSLILVKVRAQFGLRNFAELSILVFVLVMLLHIFVRDLQSALIVRFFSGIAASPISTLAFLYMLEPLPPAKKLSVGQPLVLTNIALGAPLARLISPDLLMLGDWHGLYLFEIALAMMAFAAVYLLPLTPPPRAKVIHWLDVVSYLFIAVGFGLIAMVFVLGRVYWWFEAPWLGVMLALGLASLTCAVAIELNRETPFLDIRWLAQKEILHLAGTLMIFRLLMSEQTAGAFTFFQSLGLQNEQMTVLSLVVIGASITAGLGYILLVKPGRETAAQMVALVLLLIGALMDSNATSLTRPEQMYVSQALIAAAGVLFLPPAMATGLALALQRGPTFILNFIVVFLTTQSLGGVIGSALVGTFITWRTRFHLQDLVDHLASTNPLVSQRIAQLAGTYGRVITDRSLLNAEGVALLGQQVTREATVLAYNDAFLAIALAAAFTLAAMILHLGIRAIRKSLSPEPQPAVS
ncbi:MFS transporter [Microvirga terrae]|uniref:MFS transporter n=1 Tax=Microvirga terrae TaxID=2740529 RepID=A0ABY5RXM7_9HYPH|nr:MULTISPECIES: MFS transporter [Microvirga]MBQ0823781.1 MFS transporter [Microvirga sp. HBU67558]UVF22015.1 MFS transporter [Microvirga terrae]